MTVAGLLLLQRRMSRCKCSELMRALKISVSSTCCLPARHHWQPHHASQQQNIWLACSVLAASLQRGVCFSLKLPACQAPLASPPHLAAAPPSRFIAFTTRSNKHTASAACCLPVRHHRQPHHAPQQRLLSQLQQQRAQPVPARGPGNHHACDRRGRMVPAGPQAGVATRQVRA